jgi:hypothetical protein
MAGAQAIRPTESFSTSEKQHRVAGVSMGDLREAINVAKAEICELMGVELSSIPGVFQAENGWRIRLEVTERKALPRSRNSQCIYEVDVENGHIVRYERKST